MKLTTVFELVAFSTLIDFVTSAPPMAPYVPAAAPSDGPEAAIAQPPPPPPPPAPTALGIRNSDARLSAEKRDPVWFFPRKGHSKSEAGSSAGKSSRRTWPFAGYNKPDKVKRTPEHISIYAVSAAPSVTPFTAAAAAPSDGPEAAATKPVPVRIRHIDIRSSESGGSADKEARHDARLSVDKRDPARRFYPYFPYKGHSKSESGGSADKEAGHDAGLSVDKRDPARFWYPHKGHSKSEPGGSAGKRSRRMWPFAGAESEADSDEAHGS